jgi:hypothetical protein
MPMNYRALFAMIKIADQIGQTDPNELAAMLHWFPKTLHLPQASLDFLSKLQARANANSRQRQLLGTRPNLIHKHRTQSRMNEDLSHEEFAAGSQG